MGLSHKSELTPHRDGLVIPNIMGNYFWFDLIFIKKINKLVFFKKNKQKLVQIHQFRFGYFRTKIGSNRPVSVRFGSASVRLCYFILKTKS
jgi:hypothetical protein